jgi:hypothetical protein
MKLFQYLPFSMLVGFAAGVSVDQADETDKAVRLGIVTAQEFLAGSAALGAAFGAIVIAVLALISVWFDAIYLDVLNERRGWDYAMTPFRVTGTVSVLTTLVAVIGIFVFPPAALWVRALMLGLTGGLLMWSILGTLVVISLLFEHGHERAETMADLSRGKIRRRIQGLQRQLQANKLSQTDYQLQKELLSETLPEGQRRLLETELNDESTGVPPEPPLPSGDG